jgi:hypothetical protein
MVAVFSLALGLVALPASTRSGSAPLLDEVYCARRDRPPLTEQEVGKYPWPICFLRFCFSRDVDVSVEEDMAALQFAPKMWYSSCSSFDLLYARNLL